MSRLKLGGFSIHTFTVVAQTVFMFFVCKSFMKETIFMNIFFFSCINILHMFCLISVNVYPHPNVKSWHVLLPNASLWQKNMQYYHFKALPIPRALRLHYDSTTKLHWDGLIEKWITTPQSSREEWVYINKRSVCILMCMYFHALQLVLRWLSHSV